MAQRIMDGHSLTYIEFSSPNGQAAALKQLVRYIRDNKTVEGIEPYVVSVTIGLNGDEPDAEWCVWAVLDLNQ